jgi:hypothetical protein
MAQSINFNVLHDFASLSSKEKHAIVLQATENIQTINGKIDYAALSYETVDEYELLRKATEARKDFATKAKDYGATAAGVAFAGLDLALFLSGDPVSGARLATTLTSAALAMIAGRSITNDVIKNIMTLPEHERADAFLSAYPQLPTSLPYLIKKQHSPARSRALLIVQNVDTGRFYCQYATCFDGYFGLMGPFPESPNWDFLIKARVQKWLIESKYSFLGAGLSTRGFIHKEKVGKISVDQTSKPSASFDLNSPKSLPVFLATNECDESLLYIPYDCPQTGGFY